jgi:hypothetical protein
MCSEHGIQDFSRCKFQPRQRQKTAEPPEFLVLSHVAPGIVIAGGRFDETVQLLREGIRMHLEALAQDRIERPWLYEKRQVG